MAQPLIKREVVNIKNSFLKKLRGDDNYNDDIAIPPTMMEQLHKTQGRGNNKTNDGNELEKKMGKVKEVRSYVKGYAQVLVRYIILVSMWESKDDG